MKLTAEQLKQLELTQLANVLRKQDRGKILTRREHEILARHKKSKQKNFVQTWDELADQLGVSRLGLEKIRKRLRLTGDLPRDRADRRKEVNAWRKFFFDHKLWGEVETVDSINGNSPNKAHWDRERAKVDFETALFRLGIEQGKHVELDDICAAVGQMLAGFRTAINMLPGSAARWLIGLKDFHEIKERLESEVDGVLQALGRCKYVGDVAAKAAKKAFPDKKQKERDELCELVNQIFMEIGREALKDLMQRDYE